MIGFTSLRSAYRSYQDTARKSRQLAQLFEMSDAQLAKRGLTRDTIVDHVFKG